MKKFLVEPKSRSESRKRVSEPEVRSIEIIPPEECTEKDFFKVNRARTSQVVQWLRLHLPKWEVWV